MSISSAPTVRLTAQAGALARRCFRTCSYRDDLVQDDIPLPGDRSALIAYAHRPFDTRSACIAVLPATAAPANDVTACRDVGASLFFTADESAWHAWKQTPGEPQHLRTLRPTEVENYFRQHREDFAPGTIFRAKTWQRAGVGRQLDFVDAGLLPMLEREAGGRLLDLFERMVAVTMNGLEWDSVPDDKNEAHWLTKANFWLLAAKLLHDKRVPRFINLDLHDVRTVFDRVANHYNCGNPDPPRINGKLRALQEAARIASVSPHFRNLSAETLGMLYEEALISPITRKLLGTHRTPTYLVDYMLARLSGWISELGPKRCHIFEPACGHAPFLSGALRLLSDMLPPAIADDPKRRHDFLRDHLRGCDRDPFALEIARLSLTLADIPNENGWIFDGGDMFTGDYLDQRVAAAGVVLANPPFGPAPGSRASGDLRPISQSVELLRRTIRSLQPGSLIGFVMPQTMLDSVRVRNLRRELLNTCELLEISVFPDKMFAFPDVETTVILGRRFTSSHRAVYSVRFRRVREPDMPKFQQDYFASNEGLLSPELIRQSDIASLLLPDLHQIWAACGKLPAFFEVADIGQGLSYKGKSEASGITITDKPEDGTHRGWITVRGAELTHGVPVSGWLNLAPEVLMRSRYGTLRGVPQVLLNYARVSREAWRHKAFIDREGRPATSNFLLIRPRHPRWSLECLWALCNSPFFNAYSYAHTSKKFIFAGFVRQVPVPNLDANDPSRLEAAVRAYRDAATAFTTSFKNPPAKSKSRPAAKKSAKTPAGDQLPLGLPGQPADEEIAAARDRLRALHWRVDAEVLRLYALPPELERELLDAFDRVPRVGVPFEQTRYIPRDFRHVQTLDEFLRITDEWDATDTRRGELIEKRIKAGRRTAGEETEFRQLQRLLTLHRRFYFPLPTEEIKAFAKRFKEGREWASED